MNDLQPCDYCATPTQGQVDHSIPRVQGGSNLTANLAHACWRCNSEKGGRTVEEWATARTRVGLSWPPIGWTAFIDGLKTEMTDDEQDLVAWHAAQIHDVIHDLYRISRHVPTFTFVKAAADLKAAAHTP
jgi:hypothetical protein